jgi:hypothetical protein
LMLSIVALKLHSMDEWTIKPYRRIIIIYKWNTMIWDGYT